MPHTNVEEPFKLRIAEIPKQVCLSYLVVSTNLRFSWLRQFGK